MDEPQTNLARKRTGPIRAADGSFRGYIELPSSLFLNPGQESPAFDEGLKPEEGLPHVAFYIEKQGKLSLLRDSGQSFPASALIPFPSIWVKEAHISLLADYLDKLLKDPTLALGMETDRRMRMFRKAALLTVEEILIEATEANLERGKSAVRGIVKTLLIEPQNAMLLAKVSSNDPATYQHLVGTCVHSVLLARKMGIRDENALVELGLASLLHDIGKEGIDDDILFKDGPLTATERLAVESHSLVGYEMLRNSATITERTRRIILEHHEDMSGTGYPGKLTAPNIDPFSKIVAVCDTFDSLTTDRTYSNALSPFEALDLMRTKLMKRFDEKLFRGLVLIYAGQLD
jgi:putative nucleotidyltransferase with HDIG domain